MKPVGELGSSRLPRKSPHSCLGLKSPNLQGRERGKKTNKQERFIGIDISKDSLEVNVLPEDQPFVVSHDEEGIRSLSEQIRVLEPTLVILEATGGWEELLVARLASAQLPVVVINPRQGRDFAKARGRLAKTDRIDAKTLAMFGQAIRPQVRPLKTSALQEFEALVARRE